MDADCLIKITRAGYKESAVRSFKFEAYVAGQYRAGEVSLRQAAALLGVTLWEALDRLAALGATGNATAESVLAGLDTLEAKS